MSQPTTDSTGENRYRTMDGSEALDAVFAALAGRERRELLGTLFEQAPEEMTRGDLTATGEGIQFHHVHLPYLESAGLIQVENDTISCSDHPAYEDDGVIAALTGEGDGTTEELDALFEALSTERHRQILDILSHQFQPIHFETLARELGATELGTTEQAVPAEQVSEILTSLTHVHLPQLADAGLVNYDRTTETVGYEGHPALRVPWMHSEFECDFPASLVESETFDEIGTVEGREQVVSYGQHLGERADEELFCMFTHKDMLEAGCFSRIIDAANRGVTVYLGTYDPTVREFAKENVPDAHLWEPKTDWMNLPVEGNKVGRLIMSDREAVMLGTLKEQTDGTVPEEKALIGEGSENALVVMIQQMLSPHLDRLEAETDAPEAELPF